ncbi:zinc finger (C2H2 type) family protein [Actinidia rufa]|uniref:Zinc finger (C2H2 type) family protein n=1 Tax=Actinidia rufa TaxID=165716 RepID=A0A7J0DUV9_9ERIC|nr:zinc finger (C2H2 type) family protein [Actinidia rufa]
MNRRLNPCSVTDSKHSRFVYFDDSIAWLAHYNPASAVAPTGWPVPPRPQLWFPHHPAVSVPPAPLGLVQQSLFPVQNMRHPMPPTVPPALQPSLSIAPPGLPPATPIPVSQPLFPVVAKLKSSIDASNNAAMASNYHTPGIQGGTLVNSHSYASGPNTGGPSIGPPPVIANTAPAIQPKDIRKQARRSHGFLDDYWPFLLDWKSYSVREAQ